MYLCTIKADVRVSNAGRDRAVAIKKKTPPDQCSIVRPTQYISLGTWQGGVGGGGGGGVISVIMYLKS